MFLEVQSEMIDGRRFPTACRVAYSFITMVYTLTTTVAYGMQGDAVAPFLPDSLTDGALKRVVGACLAFHILVAYVVTAQPLTAFLYSKAFRATPLHPTTPAVRLRWLRPIHFWFGTHRMRACIQFWWRWCWALCCSPGALR